MAEIAEDAGNGAADAGNGPDERSGGPLLRDPPPPPGYSNPVEESEVLEEPFSAPDQP